MTDLGAAPTDGKALAALRLVRTWWPSEATYSIRLALTSIAAMYLCMLFELDTPEWAGWTVISVSLATRANSLQKSLWRIVGSVCGGVVALAMVAWFAQDTLAFDIALACWVALVCFIATIQRGLRTYGFAVMGYTVPIVVLNDVQHPQEIFYTAIDRCSTITIGIACSYASSVLVARGVRSVARSLAGTMETAVRSCAEWADAVRDGVERDRPPISTVLALDTAVFDAFTEQPSLRTGRLAVSNAPIALLDLLAIGILRVQLPREERSDPRALLGRRLSHDEDEWARLDAATRDLRGLKRSGSRRAPAKPLALDWDGWQAARNAGRAVIALSLTNAFWYVSNWPPGSGMVTWAALITLLYATRDDGAEVTRNFLVGAVLACVVGTVVRYVVLTASFSFPQLVLVLLPLTMLATIGHSETKAAFGGGYAFLILDIVGPKNVMDYNLGTTANGVLADVLGMGLAVMAFSSLMPPATATTRAHRARRRMSNSVRAIAGPTLFLPKRDTWVARMFHRLDRVSTDAASAEGGQILLLVGMLLLTLRHEDERLGRELARALWFDEDRLRATLARVREETMSRLQRERIDIIAAMLRTDALEGWPSAPCRLPA